MCAVTGGGLPSKTNGRPKTIHGSFRSLYLSNESGTSERSSKVGDDSWIGWRGREHLRDALQMGQDRREDGESEGLVGGTRRIRCVLPLKDKLRELQSSRRKLVKSIR
jgi:hypothetical protein